MGTAKREKKEKAIAEGKRPKKAGETLETLASEKKIKTIPVKTDIIPVPEEARSLSRVFNILTLLNPQIKDQIESVVSGRDVFVMLPGRQPILISVLQKMVQHWEAKNLTLMKYELQSAHALTNEECLGWIRDVNLLLKAPENGVLRLNERLQIVSC